MKIPLFLPATLAMALTLSAFAQTAPPASGELVKTAELDASDFKTEGGAAVALAEDSGAKVIKLTFPESKGYPGADFPKPDGGWDLSEFRAVEADLVNNGPAKVGVALRVDNPGDWTQSPWNSNVLWLEPGAGGTLTVTFGETFGNPGYALDPARVSNIKIFLNTPKEGGEVMVQSLKAIAK